MIVWHVTTAGVLPEILRDGIRPDKAETVRREVWLVEGDRVLWAFLHVARRHKARLQDLRAVKVQLPASRLRSRGNGLHTCDTTIGPERFRAVKSLALRNERFK